MKVTSMTEPQPFVNAQQAAKFRGTTTGQQANERSKGIGPRYYKVGGKVLYRLADIEEWMNTHAVETRESAR